MGETTQLAAPGSGAGMKVGYLVNQYPKVSHTFIRREIRALEGLGVDVHRFSIRPSPDELPDPDDQAEQRSTRVLLEAGAKAVVSSVARARGLGPAAALAARMGRVSDRGLARHGAYLAEACLLRAWATEAGLDHIHAHFGTNPAAVAMLCHALGGPPFSFTVHGPEEFDKPFQIALDAKIARARFVVAISSYGRAQMWRLVAREHWDKIHRVACGLDAPFLEAPATPVPAAPRLVCVGRLCEQKGQLLLVEAAHRLDREGMPFELVLVGDGPMRGDVQARIRALGLQGKVRITGWMSSAEVLQALRDARALVLPSFAEGLPIVIMEALALGRPVISTYVAGIPELVGHGECGWLAPAGDVNALVAHMRSALTASAEAMDALGAEGRRRVRQRHDVRTCAARLKALFAGATGRE